jgi:hypothetical protein
VLGVLLRTGFGQSFFYIYLINNKYLGFLIDV